LGFSIENLSFYDPRPHRDGILSLQTILEMMCPCVWTSRNEGLWMRPCVRRERETELSSEKHIQQPVWFQNSSEAWRTRTGRYKGFVRKAPNPHLFPQTPRRGIIPALCACGIWLW